LKISRTRLAIGSVLLAGAAIPVLAQDRPESLLPPGFDQPSTPAPAPRPTRAPTPTPDAGLQPSVTPAPGPGPAAGPIGNEIAADDSQATAAPIDLTRYELPESAKRSLDRIGVSAAGNPAFPANAFGRADGRYLQTLMRRLDAPVASRWVSIVLRRALQSRIDTPANVNGADFAAERAWLLLRMGEAIAARALIQEVDTENYTPFLFRVGMQVALANGDPGGLCPLADPAAALPERGWAMARAMCAGLAGEPNKAGELMRAARQGSAPGSIDNLLAEKVAGAGGRGAVTIEWQGVNQLNAWRWGLATATGVAVPDALYRTVGPQVRYWQALSPSLASRDRAVAAELAASQGVFSNAGLVELYGEIEQEDDASSALVAVGRDLRTAYTDPEMPDRIKALKTLWSAPESTRLRYARLVLTARAAAGITPDKALAEDADQLVASMLSAGLDTAAMGWRDIVARGSDGWAMLALADPAAGAQVAASDFDAYRSGAEQQKAQLVFAGLAGLGKLGGPDVRRLAVTMQVDVTGANAWTRAIDAAARRGDAGTVALLAATGMQSRGWGPVAPEALLHSVAALRAVGMGNYARMIAVEAVSRI
jgi:hypothetical protein